MGGYNEEPATYASAGVDIAAGDRAVDRIRALVSSTSTPGVIGGIGGFGGCFALDTDKFTQPVLVASTDGVGTKMLIAQATGRYDTIGIDLVAMCVDDLVCAGATPLFLLDYVATGKLDTSQITQVVSGIAEGCRMAGCALLGGEMAEHPGAMAPGDLDIAGFAVGAVERDAMLGPQRVRVGDVLVGLPSPGLRSNGYTLARHVLMERSNRDLEDPAWAGADTTLAEELLRPSVIYSPSVLAATGSADVHAVAHVTGGGIPGNLKRVLPEGCDATLERGSWAVPRIFDEIRLAGSVEPAEMDKVFNLGLGMVLVIAADDAGSALHALRVAGQLATVVGTVESGDRTVRIVGAI